MKSTLQPSARRRFLQGATASLTAPFILPSRVWSAETAPNERLNLGFIGMGKMNSGHLRNFLGRKEVQVVAVCDVDTTRREHAQKTVNETYAKEAGSSYKGCDAYNEFEALLARKDIDAVVIAKPVTNNRHEALTLTEALRSSGRMLQTGSQQRSSKEFRVAAELVRNGVIGKLQRIETSFGDPAPVYNLPTEELEPGLDWDRWCGPGPLVGYSAVQRPHGEHTHFPA